MNNITLQDLLDKLEEYNPEEVEIVKRAYEYADTLHCLYFSRYAR